MSTLASLTRRLAKLEAATRARLEPPEPDHIVIFYDSDRPDKDAWLETETARRLEQVKRPVRAIVLMPHKETDEENAARYRK